MLKSCCFLAVIFAEIWTWKLRKIPSEFPPQRRSVSWLTQWNTAAQKQEASGPPRFNLFTNMGSQRLKCCIVLVSNDSLTPNIIQIYTYRYTSDEQDSQNPGFKIMARLSSVCKQAEEDADERQSGVSQGRSPGTGHSDPVPSCRRISWSLHYSSQKQRGWWC